MFQSFLAVPLHFTVEFLGFLVCAGGAFLAVSRNSLIPGPPSNRITAALGLGALAAAQVLHGGSFVPLDSDPLLLGIYAVGFAFLAVALSGAVGPRAGNKKSTKTSTAGAFLGLPIKEPLAFASAGSAAFLALVAGTAASRGQLKALWRLCAAGVLLAASQVFMAFAPKVEFGVGEIDAYANMSHAAKALGFIALGSWLWTGVRSSIRVRFVASFAGLLLFVVLVLSSALTGVITNSVEEEQLKSTEAQLQGVANAYSKEDLSTMRDAAAVAAGDDDILNAYNDKKVNVDALSREAEELAGDGNSRGLSFALFMNPSFKRLAYGGTDMVLEGQSIPLPRLTTNLAGLPIVRSARGSSAPAASPVRISDGAAIAAASEIRSGNSLLGVVVVGRFLDEFEMDRKATTTSPALPSVAVEGKVVASQLPDSVAQRFRVPKRIIRQVEAGETVGLNQSIGTRSYFTAFAPLGTPPIDDTILILSSPASIVAATREEVTRILFLVAMGIGAVVLALAWVSGRRITRPIQRLTVAAGAVREGDLTARADVSGEDEVGQLGETFNDMTAALLRNTNDLRFAAEEEQRLRARIETIIQSMADGLVAVGPDHKVLAFNPQAEALTGIEASSAIGKPIRRGYRGARFSWDARAVAYLRAGRGIRRQHIHRARVGRSRAGCGRQRGAARPRW